MTSKGDSTGLKVVNGTSRFTPPDEIAKDIGIDKGEQYDGQLGLNEFNRALQEAIGKGIGCGLTPEEIIRRVKEHSGATSEGWKDLKKVSIADFLDEERRIEKLKEIESEQVFTRFALFKGDRPLVIVAQSGIGKSTLLAQEAMLWTVGQGFLLTPAKPLRVLILETEEHDSDYLDIVPGVVKYARMHGVEFDQDAISSQLAIYPVSGLYGEQLIQTLEGLINESFDQGNPFDIVVLNPALSFLGGDASSQETVTRFLRSELDPLVKRPGKEVALCLIHHTKKVNQDTASYAANDAMYATHGSAEWTNASRTVITLQYHQRNLDGVYVAYGAKRGSTLGWKDSEGKPTNQKIIGHAPKIDEYGNPLHDRYWRELTEDELAEIKESSRTETKADFIAKCADKCGDWFSNDTVIKHSAFSERCIKEFKITKNRVEIVGEIVKDLKARCDIVQEKFGKDKAYWIGRREAVERYKQQQTSERIK